MIKTHGLTDGLLSRSLGRALSHLSCCQYHNQITDGNRGESRTQQTQEEVCLHHVALSTKQDVL